jgi:hypothetical protein
MDKVDSSITLFKHLIREAGWGPDTEGTIKLFQDILPIGLHRTICQRETLPATLDEWYDATRKTVQRWQDLCYHRQLHLANERLRGSVSRG